MERNKAAIASQFLALLRVDREKLQQLDSNYIPLAAKSGLSAAEIAARSGLPVERVKALIEVSRDEP